jgi:hypothetical protein
MVPKRLAYLSGVGLSVDEVFSRAAKFVEENNAVAAILDSMGLAMAGADMDRAKDVIAFHSKYVNLLRRAGATPIIVDHEGKLQAGEKRREKGPTGSAFKGHLGRNVLQFILNEYDQETSTVDVRIRQHKTNFAPVEPFGVKFTFEEKKVSITTYKLDDAELLEEEVVPVEKRILAALEREEQTVVDLEALTGAARGTLYNKLRSHTRRKGSRGGVPRPVQTLRFVFIITAGP